MNCEPCFTLGRTHIISKYFMFSDDPTELGCPRDLRQGDLYTHTFHPYRSCIVDPDTLTIYSDVIEAKKRGVLFDVGHGQGSFGWTVAEICARNQFYPDTISTDLHSGNHIGPAYDLPTVMSKFLHLGRLFKRSFLIQFFFHSISSGYAQSDVPTHSIYEIHDTLWFCINSA